jgi:hypothetical protein
MEQLEIGTLGTLVGTAIGTIMIVVGFWTLPKPVKTTAMSVIALFMGWAIIEFIAESVIVIAQ